MTCGNIFPDPALSALRASAQDRTLLHQRCKTVKILLLSQRLKSEDIDRGQRPAIPQGPRRNNFTFSGEIFVQVRVSESHFESEIPGVFRNADLGKKIPENGKLFLRGP